MISRTCRIVKNKLKNLKAKLIGKKRGLWLPETESDGKMEEGAQKAQTCGFKISDS